MFVVVLFGHIVGVLILFVAFALEWVALRQLRRSATVDELMSWVEFTRLLPRLHRAAAPLILLTGAYMASELSLWQSGWIPVSLASLVILAIVGMTGGARLRALGRVSTAGPDASEIVRDPAGARWLVVSFRLRVSAMLGIVYLMVAKPDLVPSLTIVTTSALAGAVSTFRMWQGTRGAAGARRAVEDTAAFADAKRQRA